MPRLKLAPVKGFAKKEKPKKIRRSASPSQRLWEEVRRSQQNPKDARPLSDLVIQTFANYETRLTRRSASPSQKNWGDGANEKRIREEARRSQQIIELGWKLRQSQGGRVECPLIPCFSLTGTIKPISTHESPGHITIGVYRYEDIERYRDLLIVEDRAIKSGSALPLDIPRDSQEVTLSGKNTHSLRDQVETRFKDLKHGFLKIRGRKRPDRLSRYGRHSILESGAVIDRLYGKNAVFVTTTIPGSTRDAIKAVGDNSQWLMNRLLQVIRDIKKCKGIIIDFVYSWELQERGALHPHIILAADPKEVSPRQLLSIGQEIEYLWFELLAELLDKTGVDCFECGNRKGEFIGKTHRYNPDIWQRKTMMVDKSVFAYLGKYASKSATPEGKDKHQQGLDSLYRMGIEDSIPGRWWNCSYNLKKEIQKRRFKITIPIAWMSDPELLGFIYSIIEGEYLQGIQYLKTSSLNTVSPEGCKTTYDNILERSLGYRWDVSRNGRTVIHGETEIYWHNPKVADEIQAQLKAVCESKFNAVPSAKFSSTKRVTSDSVLSRIVDSQHERRTQQEIKVTGVDPGTGMIIDLEQFCQYQEWEMMRDDSWYRNETFRMADEEIEWSAKVWAVWFDQLQNMNKQNEYEYKFGNQTPIRKMNDDALIAAISASYEVEKTYYQSIPNP